MLKRANVRSQLRNLVFCLLTLPSLASAEPPRYPDHSDLSYFLRPNGTRAPIRTVADWQHRRTQILACMQEVLGPLPHSKSPLAFDVQNLEEHKEDGYVRRKIAYHTDDRKTRVNAWLLLPTNNGHQRRPAVLCLHQTTPNGKDSPVGLADRPTLHYAKELTKRGYVTLSPDYPSFGESTSYDFDADDYVSGTMKAIYDNIRAIDLLQSLPDVDPNRIGCIGHSLGGHNTLFTAAFDKRIKAAVTSCGFTSFHKYKGGDLKGWTSKRYMPLIATRCKLSPNQVPFDFAEVIAAIAPRAVFINAPLHDDNFDISGVHDVLNAANSIYKLLGHPERLQAVHPDSAHDFPDAERKLSYEFIDQILKRSDGATP
jgi:dienelactone hydrolase